jgi:hypothetical protein
MRHRRSVRCETAETHHVGEMPPAPINSSLGSTVDPCCVFLVDSPTTCLGSFCFFTNNKNSKKNMANVSAKSPIIRHFPIGRYKIVCTLWLVVLILFDGWNLKSRMTRQSPVNYKNYMNSSTMLISVLGGKFGASRRPTTTVRPRSSSFWNPAPPPFSTTRTTTIRTTTAL